MGMTPEQEAEMAWLEIASRSSSESAYMVALSHFKSALKREIELAMTTAPSRSAEQYNNGLIKALKLLDTVKP